MKLNVLQLKWIAVLTMVVDHIGAVLFPDVLLFRYIGRTAFPVFCFLLAEGFFHTRSVGRYLLRLGVFALLSEIPYDLAFHQKCFDFQHQNVFFTLSIGLGMMYVLSKCGTSLEKGVYVLLAMWLANALCTDYSFKGVLLIAVFYFLRGYRMAELLAGAGWNFLWNWQIQGFGAVAMLPIALYGGEKGESLFARHFEKKSRAAAGAARTVSQYFFYFFYPAHLLVLAALRVK